MKKASEVLLLIGAILSFVSLLGLLVGAIILFVFASPALTDLIIEGINNGSVHSSQTGTPEEVAAFVQMTLSITAVVLLVCMIPVVVAGIFALRASKKQDMTSYIVALVLALVFGGNIITVIGAILGIVELNQPQQGVQQ